MTTPRLPERALRYLSHPTPKGQRNAELFFTAGQYRDAGIDSGTAERELVPCAVRDGLTATEGMTAVKSAYAKPARQPIASKGERAQYRPAPPAPRAAPKPPAVKANLENPPELPKPMADGFRKLLETCFLEGEHIGITVCEMDADGKSRPGDNGQTFNREWILAKLEANGDVNRLWSATGNPGLLVRINPMQENGSTSQQVSSFRHVLVECDNMGLQEQVALYRQSELPIAALIYSGGKSIHALVKIEAADRREYDERVAYVFGALESYGIDAQCKDPARHTRIPGAKRGQAEQQLLSLAIGRKNFVEWQEWHEGSVLTVNAETWITQDPPPVVPIVENLFEAADKLLIVGSSKSRKSFFTLQFALAIASGKHTFLRWKIRTPVPVLLINCELKPAHLQRRLHHTAKRMGISAADIGDRLHIINTRGHIVNAEKLEAWTRQHNPAVLIVDPIYKLLDHDSSENDGSAWRPILSCFDRIAEEQGAAVVFVHHNPKGRAGDRDARDRGAGSGVVQRDIDSAIFLTEHRDQADCIVIQTIVRNAPPHEGFVIRFEDMLFEVADEVAPVEKTSTNSKPKIVVPESAVVASLVTSKTYGDLIADLRRQGFTLHGAKDAVAACVETGKVTREKEANFPHRAIYALTQRADPTVDPTEVSK